MRREDGVVLHLWFRLLTSSFNGLPEEPEDLIQKLEGITKVTYDLGRNTFGWEWWEVYA